MDAHEIAEILGAVVVDITTSEHPSYSLRLVNLELGIKLRLEVCPEVDEVRLFIEMTKRRKPSFVGAVTLHDVRSVSANRPTHEVTFGNDTTHLSINRVGIFVVSAA